MRDVTAIRPSLALVTSAAKGNDNFGTAFLVHVIDDAALYLTCAHVIRDVGGPEEVLLDGEPTTVVVGSRFEGPLDLAVLRAVRREQISPLKLGAPARSGEAVTMVGFHAFGRNYVLRDVSGVLGKSVRLHGRGHVAPVDAWDLIVRDEDLLKPGFSGAPVIEVESQQVVGIVSHAVGSGERGVALSIDILPTLWVDSPPGIIGHIEYATSLSYELKAEQEQQQRIQAGGIRLFTSDSQRMHVGSYPLASIFRNREEELGDFLRAVISYRIVGIVGHGGTGKTALACRGLWEIERSVNRVGAIVYHTAANIDEITMESVVASIGRSIGREQELLEIYGSPGLALEERTARVLEPFQGLDYLVIVLLDNLEKYQDDEGRIVNEELNSLITHIALHESSLRFVFTTRVRPRFPTSVTLSYYYVSTDDGLPEKEAVQLLRDLDPDDLGGLRSAGSNVMRALARRASCYPRALEAVAGMLREDMMLTPYELSGRLNEGELVQHLVRDAIMKLSAADLRIVQLVAVFGEQVPLGAIEWLASGLMQGEELRSVLRRLVNSHYISFDKANGLFSLHPIDRAFAYSRIPTCIEAAGSFCREQLARRAARYYASQRKPKMHWLEYDDLRPLLREFDQLILAGDYVEACSLLMEFDIDYLVKWGFAREALSLHLKIPEGEVSGRLAEQHFEALGHIYRTIGFLDHAIAQYERVAHASDVSSEIVREGAYNQLSRLYRRMARYDDAIRYSERALEAATRRGRLDNRTDALTDMATIRWCLGQYPRAMRLAQEALDLVTRKGWQDRAGYVEYTLAKILMSGGRLSEVVEHLVKGFGHFRQCESVHGEFVINECFAEFYFKSGDLEKAEPHAQKAIDLAVRMNSLRGQGHGYLILAKISLERANPVGVRQHAERAYEFFEQVGVPERRMASSVSRAGAALERGDEFGYVEALLDCASSPANIGDLMENYEFATRALRLAEDAQFEDLARAARGMLDDLTSRIEPLGLDAAGPSESIKLWQL